MSVVVLFPWFNSGLYRALEDIGEENKFKTINMQLGTCQWRLGRRTTAFHFLPRWSNSDQIYFLSWNNQRWTINIWSNSFQDTGHQPMKGSETWRWERWDEPHGYDHQAYRPERVSQPWCRKGNPSGAPQTELRKQSWFWEDEADGVCRTEYQRGERTAKKKNSRDVQRVPLSIWLSTDQPKHVQKLLEAEERATQKN